MRKTPALIRKNFRSWTGNSHEVVDSAERNLVIFGDRFPFRYFADAYGLITMRLSRGALLTQNRALPQWHF